MSETYKRIITSTDRDGIDNAVRRYPGITWRPAMGATAKEIVIEGPAADRSIIDNIAMSFDV